VNQTICIFPAKRACVQNPTGFHSSTALYYDSVNHLFTCDITRTMNFSWHSCFVLTLGHRVFIVHMFTAKLHDCDFKTVLGKSFICVRTKDSVPGAVLMCNLCQ